MAWTNDRATKKRRAINAQGHAHELTFSCYRRALFLKSDRTCGWLAEAIDRARDMHGFDLFAWVFMPEHVHLLIRPRLKAYRIADLLQSIKLPVARRAIAYLRRLNSLLLAKISVMRADGRIERRFWQAGGGYDRDIFEPKTLLASIEYIHANPVRRELVKHPNDWPWSSARWYAGDRDCVLQCDPIPQSFTPTELS